MESDLSYMSTPSELADAPLKIPYMGIIRKKGNSRNTYTSLPSLFDLESHEPESPVAGYLSVLKFPNLSFPLKVSNELFSKNGDTKHIDTHTIRFETCWDGLLMYIK